MGVLSRRVQNRQGPVDVRVGVIEMRRKAEFACARGDINTVLLKLVIDLAVSVRVLMRNEHKSRASRPFARAKERKLRGVQSFDEPRDESVVICFDPIDALVQKILDRGRPRFEVKEVAVPKTS